MDDCVNRSEAVSAGNQGQAQGSRASDFLDSVTPAIDNIGDIIDEFDTFGTVASTVIGIVLRFTGRAASAQNLLADIENFNRRVKEAEEASEIESIAKAFGDQLSNAADLMSAAANALALLTVLTPFLIPGTVVAVPNVAIAAITLGIVSAGILGAIASSLYPTARALQNFNCTEEPDEPVPPSGFVSPLIIDLDGDGVETTRLVDGGDRFFDLDADGFAEQTGFVSADDGLLALDFNSNGRIDDITELFGSETENGFEELSEFDQNGDNLITASDDVFGELRVWVDADGDAVTDEGELHTLTDLGITSINLNSEDVGDFDNGNFVAFRSTVEFADGSTAAIDDVFFQLDQSDTRVLTDPSFTLDPVSELLPELNGGATFANLRVTTTLDENLRDQVRSLVLSAEEMSGDQFRQAVESIVLAFSGSGEIDPQSRGEFIDARHLGLLEAVSGNPYFQQFGTNAGTSNPAGNAGTELEIEYQLLIDSYVSRFASQVALSRAQISEDAGDPIAFESPFFRFALEFQYNSAIGSITNVEFVSSVSALVSDLPESSSEALLYLDVIATLLAGAKGDLFEGSAQDFEAALSEGLSGIEDLAIRDFVLARAIGSNLILGTSNNDFVVANDPDRFDEARRLDGKSSILDGGTGDDTLTGEKGGDFYFYQAGDGNDTIDDQGAPNFFATRFGFEFITADTPDAVRDRFIADGVVSGNIGGVDRLLLSGINRDTVTFVRDEFDLILEFENSQSDSIRILNQLSGDGASEIEEFVFSDEILTSRQVRNIVLQADGVIGTDEDDILIGTSGDDVFDGGLGSDIIEFGPGSGEDLIIRGDDVATTQDRVNIDFASTNSIVIGDGATAVLRFFETAIAEDGTASRMLLDDVLTIQNQLGSSSSSRNIKLFTFSDGVQLSGSEVRSRAFNEGLLEVNANFADVVLSREDGSGFLPKGDLVIRENGVEIARAEFQFDEEVFEGQAGGFEYFVFLDGTLLTRSEIALLTPLTVDVGTEFVAGTSGDETIIGSPGDDDISAGFGNDTVIGGLGDDRINGDEGFGFDDGPAATVGSDTYVYASGDGNDLIIDRGQGGVDTDRLVLTDLSLGDVELRRIVNTEREVFGPDDVFETTYRDLLVTDKTTGQTITVRDQFSDDLTGIELIEFADGTTVDREFLNFEVPLVDATETTLAEDIDIPTAEDIEELEEEVAFLTLEAELSAAAAAAAADAASEAQAVADAAVGTPEEAATQAAADQAAQDAVAAAEDAEFYAEELEYAEDSLQEALDLIANPPPPAQDVVVRFQELSGAGVIDGSDLFSFVRGTGEDDTALFGNQSSAQTLYGIETLRFKDLNPENLTVIRSGDDLIFEVNGGSISVTAAGYFDLDGSSVDYLGNPVVSALASVRFADGEIWDQARIAAETTIRGTDGDDNIVGSVEDENFDGGVGADIINAGDGVDVISGGLGADTIDGGAGDDRIVAAVGDGDDTVTGGEGVDVYDASAIQTSVQIDLSTNTASGTDIGTDGLSSIENAIGGRGSDAIIGNDEDNVLSGGIGSDSIDGGDGNDVLIGGRDSDDLDGGSGLDTASYRTSLSGANISLTTGVGQGGDAEGDSLSNIENVQGSNYADEITGDGLNNTLTLGRGDDTADGGAGDDEISGEQGSDSIFGGEGNDILLGGSGADNLNGGVGDDSLTGGTGADVAEGGEGSDTYIWSRGDGNDIINDQGQGVGDFDRLQISGVTPEEFRIESLRGTVFLISSLGETIELTDQLQDLASFGVEEISFDDGTTWDRDFIATNAVERPNGIVLAIGDIIATQEDTDVAIENSDLLGNDIEVDGDTLSLISVSNPTNGTVELLADGRVLFVPEPNFFGAASFDYVVSDGFGSEDTATATINVAAVNDAPVLQNPIIDQAAIPGEAFSFEIPQDTFVDQDGDVLALSVALEDGTSLPNFLSFDPTTGIISGMPPVDFNGVLSIRVTAADDEFSVDDIFELTIGNPNTAPIVVTPLADQSSPEDAQVSFAIPAGAFSDADGDALTLTALLSDGSALPTWLGFDGSTFAGTPPQDFNGSLEITVTANDGELSVSDTFLLDITPVNDAPTVSAPLEATAAEDAAVFTVDLLSGASDVDVGETATLAVANVVGLTAGVTLNGTILSIDPTNAAFQSLAVGQIQTVNVSYDVVDVQGAAVTQTAAITITGTNDVPTVEMPLADQSSSEDTAVSFIVPTGAFADIDGDALTLTATLADGAVLPAWLGFDGSTFSGTPPQDFNGSIDITVTASDGQADVSDTFRLAITSVNDAPVLVSALLDQSSPEDTAVSFALPTGTFDDVDGDALTITAQLSDGTVLPTWLSFDGETFSGTPPQDFNGSLDVTVTASDGSLEASDTFRLEITPVNDAPVVAIALEDQSSPEDQGVSFIVPADAFSDVDGDLLSFTATLVDGSALPAWLSFDGSTFAGVPPQDFNGSLDVTVTASDGSLEFSDVFSLTISPVNDAPEVAVQLQDQSSPEDEFVEFSVPADAFSDVDGDTLTLTATQSDGTALPAWLTFNANDRSFRGQPPANFAGTLAIAVVATDGQFSVSQAFELAITPVNDAPVISGPAAIEVDEDGEFNGTVIASDVENDTLSFSIVSGGEPQQGQVTFSSGGAFAYRPNANANGSDTFTVAVSDGNGGIAEQVVNVTIVAVNDAPVAVADAVTTQEDVPVSLNVVTNDIDVDGDAIELLSATAQNGVATVSGGVVSYTPNENFNGEDVVAYEISDGNGGSATGSLTITVSPANDAPELVAALEDISSPEDTAVSFAIPDGAFSDIDGDALTLSSTLANGNDLPSWLSFDSTARVFSGTPPQDFNGVLEIAVTASDGELSATDNFVLEITAVNDAPIAQDDSGFTTDNASPLTINPEDLLANDSDIEGDALNIVSVSSTGSGSVSLNSAGQIIYAPETGFTGDDTFIYTVSDGQSEDAASVTVSVTGDTGDAIIGTDGSDIIFGDLFDQNVILGEGGNDLLVGGLLADQIDGGSGNDLIAGLSGGDTITGGSGNDIAFGNSGNDNIDGGSGSDLLFGGRGNDTITGGEGNDVLFGGSGSDTFVFNQGDGTDRIADFQISRSFRRFTIEGDNIAINFDGIDNFDDLLGVASQEGLNTVLDFGNGDILILQGTQLSALDRDAFTFF